MNKHVLITGGTTSVGRALVRQIWRKFPDAEVTLLAWSEEKAVYDTLRTELESEFSLWDGQLTLHSGDIGDSVLGLKETLYEELRQSVTHVVHLAEASRQCMDKERLVQTNVIGSENVVYFASRAERLQLLLHFSDAGVAGIAASAFAETEFEHERDFRNLYERSQYEAEESVRSLLAKTPICILRVGHILDPWRLERWLNEARWAAKLPGRPALGDETPFHIVDPLHVADTSVQLLAADSAAGKTYHLVNQNPMSGQRLFAELMQASSGKSPGATWNLGKWNIVAALPVIGGPSSLNASERSAFYQGASVMPASAEVWPARTAETTELLRHAMGDGDVRPS